MSSGSRLQSSCWNELLGTCKGQCQNSGPLSDTSDAEDKQIGGSALAAVTHGHCFFAYDQLS